MFLKGVDYLTKYEIVLQSMSIISYMFVNAESEAYCERINGTIMIILVQFWELT